MDIDSINLKAYGLMLDKFEDVEERPFYVCVMSLIEKHRSLINGNRLLDIGSGPGSFGLLLKKKGFDVTCLDPSGPMISRCKEKGLKTILSRIQDYSSQEKFSIILALSSLLHVRKSEFVAQISKIHSWLDEGSLFILSMANGDSEELLDKGMISERFFALYTKEEIVSLAKKHFRLIDFNGDYISSNKRNFMVFVFQKI